jgi:hypothetical protein
MELHSLFFFCLVFILVLLLGKILRVGVRTAKSWLHEYLLKAVLCFFYPFYVDYMCALGLGDGGVRFVLSEYFGVLQGCAFFYVLGYYR